MLLASGYEGPASYFAFSDITSAGVVITYFQYTFQESSCTQWKEKGEVCVVDLRSKSLSLSFKWLVFILSL